MVMTPSPAINRTPSVTMTDAAAVKARELIDRDGSGEMMLRMAVQPGGCSGLRYELFFDDRNLDGDVVSKCGEVSLVVDQMSLPYVDGAIIDYSDTIEKQGFAISNPNAESSCACGDSFH